MATKETTKKGVHSKIAKPAKVPRVPRVKKAKIVGEAPHLRIRVRAYEHKILEARM